RDVKVDGKGPSALLISRTEIRVITFAYATWLGPSSDDGYATDQSGFRLVGTGHEITLFGHVKNVSRTPGNVRFRYAQRIAFRENQFEHLGGIGLDLDTGAQRNSVIGNRFEDISSSAIELGGVNLEHHHPFIPAQLTDENLIANNLVANVGVEYYDAAGIFVGFTTRSTVRNNDIEDVPWAGIAIGWGWGLLDPGSFPGVGGAEPGVWGWYE